MGAMRLSMYLLIMETASKKRLDEIAQDELVQIQSQ